MRAFVTHVMLAVTVPLLNINECNEAANSPCEHDGICVDTPGSYRCDCLTGYTGPRCDIDINECASNPCLYGDTCLDEKGHYRCIRMKDVDITTNETSTEVTQTTAQNQQDTPIRLRGGYYSGEGRVEIYHDGRWVTICDDSFDRYDARVVCRMLGYSYWNPTAYQSARFGSGTGEIWLDALRCTGNERDISLCSSNGWGRHNCEHSEDASVSCCQHCEKDLDRDECLQDPRICKNGGTCQNNPIGYMCICVNGWTGNDCSINIDDCLNNPCYSGGTCHDEVGYYYCEYPVGKTGIRCHLDDACLSNPCHAGSNCSTSPVNGDYICSCRPGWNDKDCSQNTNECNDAANSPCEHDGICVNTPGSYRCDCLTGYTGPRCDIDINECASNPCLYDETCLDEKGYYQCIRMKGSIRKRSIREGLDDSMKQIKMWPDTLPVVIGISACACVIIGVLLIVFRFRVASRRKSEII